MGRGTEYGEKNYITLVLKLKESTEPSQNFDQSEVWAKCWMDHWVARGRGPLRGGDIVMLKAFPKRRGFPARGMDMCGLVSRQEDRRRFVWGQAVRSQGAWIRVVHERAGSHQQARKGPVPAHLSLLLSWTLPHPHHLICRCGRCGREQTLQGAKEGHPRLLPFVARESKGSGRTRAGNSTSLLLFYFQGTPSTPLRRDKSCCLSG